MAPSPPRHVHSLPNTFYIPLLNLTRAVEAVGQRTSVPAHPRPGARGSAWTTPAHPITVHPDVRRMLLTHNPITDTNHSMISDCAVLNDTMRRAGPTGDDAVDDNLTFSHPFRTAPSPNPASTPPTWACNVSGEPHGTSSRASREWGTAGRPHPRRNIVQHRTFNPINAHCGAPA